MELFKWDYTKSVNIEEIDNQHKNLIKFINNLHEAIIKKNSSIILENLFKEILDYSKIHFKDEEKIMEKYNYPYLNEHIEKHNSYISTSENLLKSFKSGEKNIDLSLMDFLINWWYEHIGEEDQKYSKFINKANK